MILLLASLAMAEGDGTKKPIAKPETGDFSIGFNAVPVLDFALNAVNIMSDTGQHGEGLADFPEGHANTLMAKYFLSNKMAVRVHFSPNMVKSSTATDYQHPVDVADPDVEEKDTRLISDITNLSSFDYVLGGGLEMRRGGGRLWGVYGAGAVLGVAGAKSDTTYGYEFNQDAFDLGVIRDGQERTTKTEYGRTTTIGLRGFGGIEYFVANRISLGAEYGLALARQKTKRGTVSTERWDVDADGNGSRSTFDNKAGGESGVFVMGVDNGTNASYLSSNGSIMLNFYF